MNTVAAEGRFRFIFDGAARVFNTKAFSSYHPLVSGGKHYENVWVESYINIYLQLVEGQTYSFSLEFDQFDAPGFQGSANSGDGRGYVGTDIPCFVEFTYLTE